MVLTRVLTTEEIDDLYRNFELTGYQKSHYFVTGINLLYSQQTDLALASFLRGAKNVGCVACMYFYTEYQCQRLNVHLALPWGLEAAIRGHSTSMTKLVHKCYYESEPVCADALCNFWSKKLNEVGSKYATDEARKTVKKESANMCITCGKIDSKERTFEKCGICKFYSYCGKDCQSSHWKAKEKDGGNHIAECRHLQILKEYFTPRYAREIREAIIRGDDPKGIERLQTLRTKLGLNRPKEQYEELVLVLSDDNTKDTSKSPNRYEYLVGRKDGTLYFGSTPEAI